MTRGLVVCLALTACAKLPAPAPARGVRPSVSQAAALAFEDFFDSTAARDQLFRPPPGRPQVPKLLAYVNPYSSYARSATHDTTWLAAAVRSGRVAGICDWSRAPLCPSDPRGLPAIVFGVFVKRETRDTLVFEVQQVLPPQGRQLIAVYYRDYTLVSADGRWQIVDRGAPRHDN